MEGAAGFMATPTAAVRVAFFLTSRPLFLPSLSCLFPDAVDKTLNLALTYFVTSGCLLPHRFLGLQLSFLTQASLLPVPAASKALGIVIQRAKPEPRLRVELPRGTAAASCQNRAGEHEAKPGEVWAVQAGLRGEYVRPPLLEAS